MYNIWNIIIKKEMYIIQAMTGWSWRLWTGCASRALFPKIPDQKLLYLEAYKTVSQDFGMPRIPNLWSTYQYVIKGLNDIYDVNDKEAGYILNHKY